MIASSTVLTAGISPQPSPGPATSSTKSTTTSGLGPQWREIQDDIIEFVTGHRPASVAPPAFATVMFTDIVDSTALEAELGDRAWRSLLERHDRLAHELITGGGGRVIKHTGDGVLAT